MKCPDGCTCRRHIGHPQSIETRAIIGRTHAGKAKSPEHRAKLAEAARKQWQRHVGDSPNKGVKFSDEARANMSRARMGNTNARRHGQAKSPTWISWKCMIDRCTSRNPYYGGRGVTVCDRWRSFDSFFEDMGERPDRMTLDRIDPDGNYEPSNCRWATAAQQRANHRRKEDVIA